MPAGTSSGIATQDATARLLCSAAACAEASRQPLVWARTPPVPLPSLATLA